MSEIKILQGDATELFKDIKSNSVDLIIADPPYNLGKNYGNNHDLKKFEDYLNFSSIFRLIAGFFCQPLNNNP